MEKQGFDLAMHYFRAFAIFSVISVHMWIVPPLEGHESMSRFLDMLRGFIRARCILSSFQVICFIFWLKGNSTYGHTTEKNCSTSLFRM